MKINNGQTSYYINHNTFSVTMNMSSEDRFHWSAVLIWYQHFVLLSYLLNGQHDMTKHWLTHITTITLHYITHQVLFTLCQMTTHDWIAVNFNAVYASKSHSSSQMHKVQTLKWYRVCGQVMSKVFLGTEFTVSACTAVCTSDMLLTWVSSQISFQQCCNVKDPSADKR